MNIPNSESSAFGNRLGIWTSYLQVYNDNRFIPIGTSGIMNYQNLGIISLAGSNAHNQLIDGLARFGFAFFVLQLVLIFLMFKSCFKYLILLKLQGSYQINDLRILGIFVVFITACFLESLISWNTLKTMSVAQLLIFLYFFTFCYDNSK